MTISTHFLALIVGLIYPAYSVLTHKRTNKRIKSDDYFRLLDYKQTIFLFWILTFIVLGHSLIDKSIPLNFYPTFNTIGIVMAVLILIFIVLQIVTSKVKTTEKASSILERMKDIYHYLPKSKREFNWFNALSLSAGLCEEIIFRLFLFSYLIESTNLFLALIITNVVFALTHIGTGKKNLGGAFILGSVFTAIYYFTNNIWLAMILHSAIDISVGFLSYASYNIIKATKKKD